MPTLRQKKLPCNQETLRSLRLWRKPANQTVQLAKQEAGRTPTQVAPSKGSQTPLKGDSNFHSVAQKT